MKMRGLSAGVLALAGMSESMLRAMQIRPVTYFGGKRSILNRRSKGVGGPFNHDREIARRKRQNPHGDQFPEYTRWAAKKFGDGGSAI